MYSVKKNVTYVVGDINFSITCSFDCVRPNTFINRFADWYSSLDFLSYNTRFSWFCAPSLVMASNAIDFALRHAVDSSALGFNGLCGNFTFAVSDTCQLFVYIWYNRDVKKWTVEIEFQDKATISISDGTEDTTQDTTEDTTQDTKDTTQDTKGTTQDTKGTTDTITICLGSLDDIQIEENKPFLPVPLWFYQRANIYIWSAILSAYNCWYYCDRRKRVIVKPVRISPHGYYPVRISPYGMPADYYPYKMFVDGLEMWDCRSRSYNEYLSDLIGAPPYDLLPF